VRLFAQITQREVLPFAKNLCNSSLELLPNWAVTAIDTHNPSCMKIRQLIVLAVLFFGSTGSFAQALSPSDPGLFDFWLGRWNLTWKNQNGTEGRGTNLIERVLDGQVIRENFEDVKGFKGMSLSVLNARTKTWRQAWVDNQGGYIDLEVFVEGDKRGFRTPTTRSERADRGDAHGFL
jgi:hypothetical protein